MVWNSKGKVRIPAGGQEEFAESAPSVDLSMESKWSRKNKGFGGSQLDDLNWMDDLKWIVDLKWMDDLNWMSTH